MNTIKSKLFSLQLNDVEKAMIMAVLTPVAGYIGQCLQAGATGGSFAISWSMVWHFALTGFVGYLTKNFLTNSQGKFLSAEPPQQ